MKKKILISTGGSGGHVVPATILYEHLKDQFEVLMTSDKRGVRFLKVDDYNLSIFNVNPISKNFFLIPFQFFLILSLIIKSLYFFKKGSGWLSRIPPGLTLLIRNRLSQTYAVTYLLRCKSADLIAAYSTGIVIVVFSYTSNLGAITPYIDEILTRENSVSTLLKYAAHC